MKPNRLWTVLAAALLLTLFVASTPRALALTLTGALSNFDCYNNSGEPTDEFELNLENVSPSEIYGTWNFNPHYGRPTVTAVGTGTVIHYKGKTNNITLPGTLEHFGVILPSFPTSGVTYCWIRGGVKIGAPIQFPIPVVTIVPTPATPTTPERQDTHREVRNNDPTNTFWVERSSSRVGRAVGLEDLMTTNSLIRGTTNVDDKPKRLRPGGRLSDDAVASGGDAQSEVLSLRVYEDNQGKQGRFIGTFMSAAVTISRPEGGEIRRGRDGRTTASFTVEPGTNYAVQVSSDLNQWTTVGTLTTNRTKAQFRDDSSTNSEVRYYRLRQQ